MKAPKPKALPKGRKMAGKLGTASRAGPKAATPPRLMKTRKAYY